MGHLMDILDKIDSNRPVLIYGPTASGKTALALKIAEAKGGVIVNADALQIYQGWPILTAQPDTHEKARAPHYLYDYLPYDAPYSVGDWLRDVSRFLSGPRPIIVGGTGLYFTALTEGLADIPHTPSDVREYADGLPLTKLIADLDPETASGLDLKNRARVQRAWEVQRTTGRSIRAWQADTPPPILPLEATHAFALMPDVPWLNTRIAHRFDQMLDAGALQEARAMAPKWRPKAPSSKAIGARELIDVVHGRLDIESAREAIIIATRQYAKRQRSWARARMKRWEALPLPDMG